MIGFINLFSVFLLILRKFWPKSFKTLMLSQELKKKVKTPGVPGCFRGRGRSGARSGLGCTTGLPRGFNLLIECHEWQATFQIFFQYKTLKTEFLELDFFKDNFHVHFLTFHGHNF